MQMEICSSSHINNSQSYFNYKIIIISSKEYDQNRVSNVQVPPLVTKVSARF